jgi:deaminated glutathione amidase
MRVTVIQLNSHDDVDENLARAEKMIRAAYEDVPFDLAILPEYTNLHGASSAQLLGAVETVPDGKVSRFFRTLAMELSIAIHCGTINEPAGSKMYNSSVVFGPDGSVLVNYKKMHLIEATLANGRRVVETARFVAGSEPGIFEFKGVRFGCATCYDFRFPELFRALRRAGADVILFVTALAKEQGAAHQEILLRARAIETQCYLLAAAQCGVCDGGKRASYGNSMIIDPWGRIEARLGDEPGYISTNIRGDLLREIRDRMDILSAADRSGLDATSRFALTRARAADVLALAPT